MLSLYPLLFISTVPLLLYRHDTLINIHLRLVQSALHFLGGAPLIAPATFPMPDDSVNQSVNGHLPHAVTWSDDCGDVVGNVHP